jgi:hypothetical protein
MKLKSLLNLGLMLAVFAVAAMAADIDGAWTSSMQGPNGQSIELKMNFKADGEKLTGSMASPMGETAIADGKIDGAAISFKIKRERNGNSMVMTYKGTLAGDELKLTSTMEGSDRPPREFVAKRVK